MFLPNDSRFHIMDVCREEGPSESCIHYLTNQIFYVLAVLYMFSLCCYTVNMYIFVINVTVNKVYIYYIFSSFYQGLLQDGPHMSEKIIRETSEDQSIRVTHYEYL